MKKEQYDSMITSINSIMDEATEKGVGRFQTDDESYNGREVTIQGKKVVHFGSCGYLGLELNETLIESAIDATRKYGTGFMSSRTYIKCGLYDELEQQLEKMYNANIIIYPKVSQGHWNVMPIIIGPNDIVVFDQQAHVSMHDAANKLHQLEVETTILRHNNMEDLEKRILEYRERYDKIWYVFDGIFSMFGDSPDYESLVLLQKKYKQFYLYIDDAHGMSWSGKNGTGYALSRIELNDRIIISVSLAKGFGACGGAFVFKNKEMYNRVESWGGSYTYAGPIEPPTLGAAIASAKIHLSDDIYRLQDELAKKINYCYKLLERKGIPLISTAKSPIFYIGVGTIAMGYNMSKRLLNSGFYTNMGVYPAVPEACTGIRFTITNHLSYADIDALVDAFAYHLPLALQEEKRHIKDIARAFRRYRDLSHLIDLDMYNQKKIVPQDGLSLECYHTIADLSAQEWDTLMKGKGAFTADALAFYETVFSDQEDRGNNWNFYYYLIRDDANEVVLATFFTSCLYKEDIMSSAKVSEQIEEQRISDPYYLSTRALMMGSSITNGEHYYINPKHPEWKSSVRLLVEDLWKKQDKEQANYLLLRDFNPLNRICNEINQMGFANLRLPGDNTIYRENLKEPFFENLNKKQRYKIRTEVLPDIEYFTLNSEACNDDVLKHCYDLYLQTKKHNLSLNTFDLPYRFFEQANESENWRIYRIFYKDPEKPISMGICYHYQNDFYPIVFGMDYQASSDLNIYKKTMYLVIKEAIDNNFDTIHLGLGANATKHMFGAKLEEKVGFAIIKDNYNAMLLNSMED